MRTVSAVTGKNPYAASRSAVSTMSTFTAETDSFSECSDKVVTDVRDKSFYDKSKTSTVISEESIGAQKREYENMYITSAAHRYFSEKLSSNLSSRELLGLRAEIAGAAKKEDCMLIPIEAGELPQLMDTIQSSLKDGKSLSDILKQKYNDHIRKYGEEGHTNSYADWFAINVLTGEVMSADPIDRTYHGDSFDEELSDMEAVMELADDLKTFLRYAAFSRDTDDSEKVSRLISFIKNKQAYADYDRFLSDNGEAAADMILQALIAAGVLKSDEAGDKEKEEAVDGLMEAVRIHQQELRENKINKEDSRKVISEIQEILDNKAKRLTECIGMR